MLEGVGNLLDQAQEAKTMKARSTFIACASEILVKCIESLESPTYQVPEHLLSVEKPKKHGVLRDTPQYEIRVDNKKLVKIVGANGEEAPLDLPMEIDGKATTYGEAIGKPFSSGRFL